MAISDAEYTAWKNNNKAIRCVLVEVNVKSGGSEITRYLSSKTYEDKAANRVYLPIVRGNSVRVSGRIDLDGGSSANFGDIEVDNSDGVRDSWINDIWVNRDITVLIGDVTWSRSDFRVILSGVTADIDSRSFDSLNFKIRDKLELLNTAVTEQKLGGLTNNKDELIPLTFGEPSNISPLLIDPVNFEYQYHNGNTEAVKEVRSNGVPVPRTDNIAAGKFTLDNNPQSGKITCDVQGDKVSTSYYTTVKQIIEQLVTRYGDPDKRLTSGDLDATNLSNFDTANPEEIGVYLNRRENLRELCNNIAASVGAVMVMSFDGKLQLHKIDLPPSGTSIVIDKNMILKNGLSIREKIEVVAGHKLGFAKNYTVQENLDTGIPQEHKDLFVKDFMTVTVEDSAVKTEYKINDEPEQVDTFLIEEADAQAEANRRLALFKTPRYIYNISGKTALIDINLGDAVTITHDRFGLSGGKTGLVVGVSKDYGSFDVDVEVFA